MNRRRRLGIGLLAAVMFLFGPADAWARGPGRGSGGSVSVHGYTRKDGTYVAPHQRSAPDGSAYNNYGMPGNYDLNSGVTTPGDPDKYLDRYNEKKGGDRWPKLGADD